MEKEKNLTAVEWIEKQLLDNNLINDPQVGVILSYAKQLEKDQIKLARFDSIAMIRNYINSINPSEYYYQSYSMEAIKTKTLENYKNDQFFHLLINGVK